MFRTVIRSKISNPHKHLYGFESQPLDTTDNKSVENHQRLLDKHAEEVKEFTTFTLDEMVAKLHLSLKDESIRTREITSSHYYMHLYDCMIETSINLSNQSLWMKNDYYIDRNLGSIIYN